MLAPYDDMIKILGKCASEKGISAESIKQIYDLERGQIHKSHRDLEIEIRKIILEFMPKEEKVEAEKEENEKEKEENGENES